MSVVENLIEKLRNGKENWRKLKAEVLFQIPVGPNETQQLEITKTDQQPDTCFEIIDDLVETLQKKEKKWSKLKFNIQPNISAMVTNEERVTYEIRNTDEQKLKIIDTIVKSLKTDSDKWDICNIKLVSEQTEKLQLLLRFLGAT